MGSPFRSSALERAGTPDRLDLYVRVPRPAAWLVIVALALLVAAAVAWLGVAGALGAL